jgi:hypothetical protein
LIVIVGAEIDRKSNRRPNKHSNEASAFGLERSSLHWTVKPDTRIDLVPLPLASILLLDGCKGCQSDRSKRYQLQKGVSCPVCETIQEKFKDGAENDFSYDFSEWHSIFSANVQEVAGEALPPSSCSVFS